MLDPALGKDFEMLLSDAPTANQSKTQHHIQPILRDIASEDTARAKSHIL